MSTRAGRARRRLWATVTTARQLVGEHERPGLREAVELARLKGLPPGSGGTTNILGSIVEFSSGESFAAHYYPIFVLEQYALPPQLAGPNASPRILDCGANIGLASLYWLKAAPAARITAFEPDPHLAAILRGNLQRTGAAAVDVVEAATWTEPDLELQFWQQGAGGGRLTTLTDHAVPRSDEIHARTVRLLDYLDDDIDLLKIDIEGAETDVLLQCAPALRH